MLLRRLLRLPVDDRPALARHIDVILRDAARDRAPRTALVTVRPPVARACAPALQRMAADLRDTTRPLPAALRRAVRTFLCDGAASPLYGRDPLDAMLAAESLASGIRAPAA